MKKLLALLLALVMVIGLFACGKKDPATEQPETPENPEVPETPENPDNNDGVNP